MTQFETCTKSEYDYLETMTDKELIIAHNQSLEKIKCAIHFGTGTLEQIMRKTLCNRILAKRGYVPNENGEYSIKSTKNY